MATKTFKKLSSSGNATQSFNFRQEDATPDRLSMLFRLVPNSIFLTTVSNEVIWQDTQAKFPYLYDDEYFVNGDPSTTTTTQINRITSAVDRSYALDTRGMPAPLNSSRAVGGFASNTQMGFSGPNASFQRINTVCAKDKSYTKTISRLEMHGDRLRTVQNYPIKLCEKTATIPKVADIINHELLVEDEIVFVDAQHLQIVDCPLTRGNAFWKGQRKIFFMPKDEFVHFQNSKHVTPKNAKRARASSNEYDDDDEDAEDDDFMSRPQLSK